MQVISYHSAMMEIPKAPVEKVVWRLFLTGWDVTVFFGGSWDYGQHFYVEKCL
jgi:carbohydrate-binding DOMON domain-containing protein